MTYIYDVILNFTDPYYYDFYEWSKSDNLINFKKIPIMYVDTNTLLDFIEYKIKVDKYFLNLIKDKSLIYKKNNKYSYTVILSNKEKSIGINFQENGIIKYKSSMLLDEEEEANKIVDVNKNEKINYKKLELNNNYLNLRRDIDNKKSIFKELKKIYDNKEYDKLKYIYFDIFSEELEDNKKMYYKIIYYLNNSVFDYSLLYETIKK